MNLIDALKLAYELLKAQRFTQELKDKLHRKVAAQIYGTELGNLKADAADKVAL